jgi:hypothetical protein
MWNIICQPKYKESLGIEILELKNRYLLRKWFKTFKRGRSVVGAAA